MSKIGELKHPFNPVHTHWRVGSVSRDKTKCMPLAYIDARAVMYRLDSVCGIDGWQDSYVESPTGRIICSLSLRFDDEWITKSDGAGSTGVEGEKGAISDAFKRAAVKFGIGRYLYYIKPFWTELDGKRLPKSFDGTAYLPPYSPYSEEEE